MMSEPKHFQPTRKEKESKKIRKEKGYHRLPPDIPVLPRFWLHLLARILCKDLCHQVYQAAGQQEYYRYRSYHSNRTFLWISVSRKTQQTQERTLRWRKAITRLMN